MPFQLGANVASCVLTPSLTRAMPKLSPPAAAWAQSIVPWKTDTSTPFAIGPPTGPLGSATGAGAVALGEGVGDGLGPRAGAGVWLGVGLEPGGVVAAGVVGAGLADD